MRKVFFMSVRLHLLWFIESFGKRGRTMAPLRPRRLALLLLGMPLYGLFLFVLWLGFLADELFFPGYRKVIIKDPLFITGVPRSGTTFVHRALSGDREQFTTFETWEALLAPSITCRKLIRLASRLDKLIGGPVHALLNTLTRRLTGRFEHIHSVGPHAPEEDYLSLLAAGGCFITVLAFPASRTIWRLGRFQEVPEDQRDMLLRFYKACLQKHLYADRGRRRLLSKNAAFASWIPDLRRYFPDARYIVCIREPQAALSSQLSSIRAGVEAFGTLPAADTFSQEFQTVLAHAYRILHQEKDSFLVDHLAVLEQRRLRADSRKILLETMKQLCVPLTPSLESAIEQAHEQSRVRPSSHAHVPIEGKAGPAEFGSLVLKLYEEILDNPHA